jgi:hypothetical protein
MIGKNILKTVDAEIKSTPSKVVGYGDYCDWHDTCVTEPGRDHDYSSGEAVEATAS